MSAYKNVSQRACLAEKKISDSIDKISDNARQGGGAWKRISK